MVEVGVGGLVVGWAVFMTVLMFRPTGVKAAKAATDARIDGMLEEITEVRRLSKAHLQVLVQEVRAMEKQQVKLGLERAKTEEEEARLKIKDAAFEDRIKELEKSLSSW